MSCYDRASFLYLWPYYPVSVCHQCNYNKFNAALNFFNHIEKRFNIILCVRWLVFIAHIALKSFAKAFYLKQHVRICATNLGDEDVYYSDSDGDDDSAISNPRDE